MPIDTTCPECGGKAISSLGKYFRGPARRFRCRSCGCRLAVSSSGMAILPLIVIPMLLLWLVPGAISVALFAIGFATASWFHLTQVPLVRVDGKRAA